ncbi:MAG: DNA helicase UvrD [Candidatus Bathyarchaeota archaeon]|nr:MAG: DNA helicase UvrD [Candidatus Bathyarchaeota archaeon]
MRVIADFHVHSRYSRATSKKMNIQEITRFAQVKGLSLMGTGDFTHPLWLKELKEDLIEVPDIDLYKPAKNSEFPVHYILMGEVSTIFTVEERVKKIHHVLLTSSLETAVQVNERLAQYGNLAVDGRPTLDMSASQLVEEVMEVSGENVVIPAHVWTPWFSIFGAFSGFNRVEDCYQDMTKHIFALETGLSSDPPMNWRLSALDRFALVSNSDCHSAWPWRIGREANVFELERLTYQEVVDAMRKKDGRFKFTIETNPAYGKYHWSGHRNCKVSLSPQNAMKLGSLCPVCRKRLTKGVEQRVEELADRPMGFKPEGAVGYMRLLPLSEIISALLGVSYPGVQKVWKIYNALVEKFGDEYAVLIDASREEMAEIVDLKIAEAIVRVREGKARVIPGYDGVYGQLVIFSGEKEKLLEKKRVKQRSLPDFV